MILVNNWPARPTNGSPCASSSAPGASPINISSASGLPTPKTVCVRERARCGHLVHPQTLELSAFNMSILRVLEGAALSTPELPKSLARKQQSALLDACGRRSVVSRISSNARTTRSSAEGNCMSDDEKILVTAQFFSFALPVGDAASVPST